MSEFALLEVVSLGALLMMGYNWLMRPSGPQIVTQKVPESKGLAPKISKMHQQVAEYLQKRFPDHKFAMNCYESWNINPKTGARLELDLYSEELKLACEINGRQHYEYIPKFHPNGEKDFKAQQYRDKAKRKNCKDRGIQLNTTPDTESDPCGFLDKTIKTVAFK